MAQTSDCAFYVQSDQTRKKISHSVYPLNFTITENIDVALTINDKGSPNTIELIFDFDDKSGLPTELGSTLYIKFIDGTTHSLLARTKKDNASIVYFTIIESGTLDLSLFIEKLSKIDITAFIITADYQQRVVLIPETKAVIIKKTINCVHQSRQ